MIGKRIEYKDHRAELQCGTVLDKVDTLEAYDEDICTDHKYQKMICKQRAVSAYLVKREDDEIVIVQPWRLTHVDTHGDD